MSSSRGHVCSKVFLSTWAMWKTLKIFTFSSLFSPSRLNFFSWFFTLPGGGGGGGGGGGRSGTLSPCSHLWLHPFKAIASLAVPGGQELHFPHFSSNFHQFSLFFLKLSIFLASGGVSCPPMKALATPLHPLVFKLFFFFFQMMVTIADHNIILFMICIQ